MISDLVDLVALSGLGSAPLVGAVTTTGSPSPSPSPDEQQGLDPVDVSPGLLGFLPVFLIALVCVGLFLSLTSKLRKVNRRQARLDAEEAAAAGSAARGPVPPGDLPDAPAPR